MPPEVYDVALELWMAGNIPAAHALAAIEWLDVTPLTRQIWVYANRSARAAAVIGAKLRPQLRAVALSIARGIGREWTPTREQ